MQRLALTMLGLPCGYAGKRFRHPEQLRKAGSRRWASIFVEPGPLLDSATCHPNSSTGAEPNPDVDDITARGFKGHQKYDWRQMRFSGDHAHHPSNFGTWEGDQSLFFQGFTMEIWHQLTRVWSWPWLLAALLSIEVVLLVFFSAVLTLNAMNPLTGAVECHTCFSSGECQKCAAEVFQKKGLLCLATLRLQSDAISGFQKDSPSSTGEIAILVVAAWFHWLMMCINSALVVARALLPIKQLVFAPDCVVNNEQLTIRVCCPRWRTVSLHNMFISVSVMVEGRTVTLKLLNDIQHWPLWPSSSTPITVQHDVRDVTSPFHPKSKFGGFSKISTVNVHVQAEDQDGNPISQGYTYFNPENSVVTNTKHSNKSKTGGAVFPRILLGAKFRDQMRTFKVENQSGELKIVSSGPYLCCNMDSFVRVVKCQTPFSEDEKHQHEEEGEMAGRKRLGRRVSLETRGEECVHKETQGFVMELKKLKPTEQQHVQFVVSSSLSDSLSPSQVEGEERGLLGDVHATVHPLACLDSTNSNVFFDSELSGKRRGSIPPPEVTLSSETTDRGVGRPGRPEGAKREKEVLEDRGVGGSTSGGHGTRGRPSAASGSPFAPAGHGTSYSVRHTLTTQGVPDSTCGNKDAVAAMSGSWGDDGVSSRPSWSLLPLPSDTTVRSGHAGITEQELVVLPKAAAAAILDRPTPSPSPRGRGNAFEAGWESADILKSSPPKARTMHPLPAFGCPSYH